MAQQRSRSASESSDEADWRACIEYETKTVIVGDLDVKVFQMEELPVAASLFMLAEMDANDMEISGKRLWTGSHFLSRYLWCHPELVRDQTILELGAGTGTCSIVATKLGARACVATDGDEEVVALLAKNMDVNECSETVKTHSLFWGDATSKRVFEEQFPSAFQSTGLILAGDVLYKQELLPLLFSTVTEVFASRGQAPCAFVLCHIPRADVTHETVQQQIRSSGLQFKELSLPEEEINSVKEALEECPIEDIERARLYYITPAPSTA